MPTLAMEAHKSVIDATVDTALARAKVTAADLAAVAVTVGPGLVMCLQASLLSDCCVCISVLCLWPLNRFFWRLLETMDLKIHLLQ